MICVSIAKENPLECLPILQKVDFAEIRLDTLKDPSLEDIRKIFSTTTKTIATCRPDTVDDITRIQWLFEAIDSGASFVDIEVDAQDQYKKAIIDKAKEYNCSVIISFHDYKRTPNTAELEQIINWCFDSGANIAKIACHINNNKDNARLLGLLDNENPLIVIGMGQKGKITRIIAPLLGSPFTFAAYNTGDETAEGQLPIKLLEELSQPLLEIL